MNPIMDFTLLIRTAREIIFACDFSLFLADTSLAAHAFGVKDLAQFIVLALICTSTLIHWHTLSVAQDKSGIAHTTFDARCTLASRGLSEAVAGLGTSSTTHIIVAVSFAGCSCEKSIRDQLITHTWSLARGMDHQ